MNAIEFLKKAKVAEYRKEVAMEKLMRCKNTVERLTSILSRDRVTSTRDVTSHETAIIRYMEAQEGAAKASVEYDEIVDKIEGLISQLDSATAQSIALFHQQTNIKALAGHGKNIIGQFAGEKTVQYLLRIV